MNDKQFEQAEKQLREEMHAIGCGWINGNYIKPPKEYALREEELSCISMINSLLCYGYHRETDATVVLQKDCSQKYTYLTKYVESLGAAKVIQLIQDQIDDIAHIQHSAYTDSEGLTYDAIVWKDKEGKDELPSIVF